MSAVLEGTRFSVRMSCANVSAYAHSSALAMARAYNDGENVCQDKKKELDYFLCRKDRSGGLRNHGDG